MPLIQLIEIQCHGILCIQAVFVKHKFIADNFLPLIIGKSKTHGVLAFCGNHAVDIAGNAVHRVQCTGTIGSIRLYRPCSCCPLTIVISKRQILRKVHCICFSFQRRIDLVRHGKQEARFRQTLTVGGFPTVYITYHALITVSAHINCNIRWLDDHRLRFVNKPFILDSSPRSCTAIGKIAFCFPSFRNRKGRLS